MSVTKRYDGENFDKLRTGDLNTLKPLFDTFYVPLCHYALKFVHDTWMAEDIVQEVFIKIWEEEGRIGTIRSVKSWLYIAVKNKCLDKLRSEKIRTGHTRSFFLQKDQSIDSNEIEYEEFRSYLSECVGKLPPRCKDAFTYSRFHGLKQEEIATEMGTSLKTVKAQIGKALKMIRDCMNIFYPEVL